MNFSDALNLVKNNSKMTLPYWEEGQFIWMGTDFYSKPIVMTNRISRTIGAIAEPYIPNSHELLSETWYEEA